MFGPVATSVLLLLVPVMFVYPDVVLLGGGIISLSVSILGLLPLDWDSVSPYLPLLFLPAVLSVAGVGVSMLGFALS